MKLSDAMRKGNAELEDLRGYVLGFFDNNPCGCAIGSCLKGAGVEVTPSAGTEYGRPGLKIAKEVDTGNYYALLLEYFPQVRQMPPCPICGNKWSISRGFDFTRGGDPGAAIECLYEKHNWPKAKILEWVIQWEKTLEPELSTAGDPIHHAGTKTEVKQMFADLGVTKEDTNANETRTAEARPQLDEREAQVLEGPNREGARA